MSPHAQSSRDRASLYLRHPVRKIGKAILPALLLLAVLASTIPTSVAAQATKNLTEPHIELPQSVAASGSIAEIACLGNMPQGWAETRCRRPGFTQLAGYSGAKTCLAGATTIGKVPEPSLSPVLCIASCTDGAMAPAEHGCANTVWEEYKDQPAWRTFAALPLETQAKLLTLYRELIPLVTSGANDARRQEIEQTIVSIVLHEMLPLRYHVAASFKYAGEAAWPENYAYPNVFGDKCNLCQEGQYAPMRIFTEDQTRGNRKIPVSSSEALSQRLRKPQLTLNISAFLKRSPPGGQGSYTIRSPNELALDLLHEEIHFEQPGFGYGETPELHDTMQLAKMYLFELQAYDLSLHNAFAKVLARSGYAVGENEPHVYAELFRKTWQELSGEQQEALARWAWALSDGWMRAKMYTEAAANEGVWGLLCTANKAPGPCGMERK